MPDQNGHVDGTFGLADEVEALAQPQQPLEQEPRGSPPPTRLTDAELEERFINDIESLGSICMGSAYAGRLINAVQIEREGTWQRSFPTYAWGAAETITAIKTVAAVVAERHPDAPPLRVSHISKKDGGHLPPHSSHQSGVDVDFGFYYKPGVDPIRVHGRRAHLIDAAANWTLLRALITDTDVDVILVDGRIQKVLFRYAVANGEDKAWLKSIFGGPDPLVQHARRHRDHFHVRFFAPRCQELGRRVLPLLAKRPDQSTMVHRIRRGDTLGRVAGLYNSTVSMIQRANGLRGSLLRIRRTLTVPMRGPCTRCPLPPVLVVPERRLPPEPPTVAAAESAVADEVLSSVQGQPILDPTAEAMGGASRQ